jgi:hypothetical protein
MYDFTKEYKLWKQSRNCSRSDQTVIQMKMSCSPWQKPLPKPEKNWQDTVTPTLAQTTVAHSLQVSGVVCPCSRARRDSVTKHIEIQGPPRPNGNIDTGVLHLLGSPSLHARAHQWWDRSITPRGLPSPSQPASTTLDHTQFYNSFHPNFQ